MKNLKEFIAFIATVITALMLTTCSSEPKVTMYTVTYYANGESITVPVPQKVTPGSIVNVAALSGYDPDASPKIFNGWNTTNDGSGSLYGAGDPLTVEQNIDLYAEWSDKVAGEIDGNYVVKLQPFGTSGVLWDQICPPLESNGVRIESGKMYTIEYSFKSNVALDYLQVAMGDASVGRYTEGEGTGYPPLYSSAVSIFNETPTPPSSIQANTVYSGMASNGTYAYGISPNATELANSIYFQARSSTIITPVLTFTKLTLRKTETVSLSSVTANGSLGKATTQLTFTFDQPVTGFTVDCILGISTDPNAPIKIVSLRGSGRVYTLNISINKAVFTASSMEQRVFVRIPGYAVGGASNDVTIYTGSTADIPLPTGFVVGVEGNSSSYATTTTFLTLTMTFNDADGNPITTASKLPTLTSNDITIGGFPGGIITKGTLSAPSGPVAPYNRWSYTLPISGFKVGGTALVSISKDKWEISNSPQNVEIYYGYEGINYTGFVGYGYNVVASPYYRSSEVKINRALNMPRLIAEGKYHSNTESYRTTEGKYVIGESLEQYSRQLSVHAGASGGFGMFSASVSVDYKISTSVASHESFATCNNEIVKERQYVVVSLEELWEKYLDDNFKNDLRNNSVTPAQLFSKYGTHIFLTVYLGGRLDMHYMYHNYSKESKSSIETKVKAAYSVVSGSVDVKQVEESSTFRSNSSEYVMGYGGTVGLDLSSFENAKKNYGAWASSIETTTNLALVKGGKLNDVTEMVPLWRLLPETESYQTRRLAILEEYNAQLNQKGLFLQGLQSNVYYISNLYMGASTVEVNAINDIYVNAGPSKAPYVNPLAGNLTSVKKEYMFLGYTMSSDEITAITDIKAYKGGGTTPKDIGGYTYTRLEYNINMNANEAPVWLYYTKDRRAGTAIKELFVERKGDISNRTGYGWTRVKFSDGTDANLNSVPIYLWMRR